MSSARCPICKRPVTTRYNLEQKIVFVTHRGPTNGICAMSEKPVK